MPAVRKYIFIVLLILSLPVVLSGCGRDIDANTVICEGGKFAYYDKAVSKLLPDYKVQRQEYGALSGLESGAAVEAFDFLAVPALEIGAAKYWYPQYKATVVIAVDRGRETAEISGWRDIQNVGSTVGIDEIGIHMVAMSYGLEGGDYTLSQATDLLETLHSQGRLVTESMEEPIVICFDYQAASMIKSGSPMEIIVPQEGTFSFEKGILSPVALEFSADIDSTMMNLGYRLINGDCDESIYPRPESYAGAVTPPDFAYMCRLMENVTRTFRREVQHTRTYTSADGREHYIMVIGFIISVMLWTGYVLQRIMQKKVRVAAILSSIFMIGWILLRAFKWQIDFGVISRYCWYGYYLFQLGLALILLWMAWVADKPDETLHPPKWWPVSVMANIILFLLVATNDLHLLVFVMDISHIAAEINYSYGPVYYLLLAVCLIEGTFAFAMLARKGWKSPRKAGFLFPLGLCVFLVFYCAGYLLRVPAVLQTDMAMTVCIFVVLFMESCIRVGLIPVNTKYKALFSGSTLKMQLVDAGGRPVLKSAHSEPLTPEIWEQILQLEGAPLPVGDDTLLYSGAVTGGRVIWQEDISRINQQRRDMEASIARLSAANAMLEKDDSIKSQLAYMEARTALFADLESEIQLKTRTLSRLIDELPECGDEQGQIARITLLLCCIKRSGNLFFRQKETEQIPAEELGIYLDELVEFVDFTGVKLHVTVDIRLNIPTRQAILFYDFLYSALEWAIESGCRTLLARLLSVEGGIAMHLLPSVRAEGLAYDEGFLGAVEKEGGVITCKDLGETAGIRLFFPERGSAS